MRAVGIRNLRDGLSSWVKVAASGETVLITERDRVVAELGPPSAGRSLSPADAILADAVRQGWITPAAFPPGPPPRAPSVATLAEILEELDVDRADR